jgi:hypothetical protein
MVIAIDPGPVQSAYVVWDGQKILDIGSDWLNTSMIAEVFPRVRRDYPGIEMVIERVACYGMAVGDSVFETVDWAGQFRRAWMGTCPECYQGTAHRVKRIAVKMHLCKQARAKDANIRQVLVDRFEPELKARQRPKSVLRGVKGDSWQALALAVYWHDSHGEF